MSLPRPCRECGETIDADRRRLLPSAMNCASCEAKWRTSKSKNQRESERRQMRRPS